MNKNVLNKLYSSTENVELSEVKVDLASATDLPKLYSEAVSMNKDIYGDTFRKVDALKAVLNQKEAAAVKMIGDIDGAMIDFSKKAKELGIDPKSTPLFNDARKELDDLYKGVKLVQTFQKGLNP